jgi:hypothetical protein
MSVKRREAILPSASTRPKWNSRRAGWGRAKGFGMSLAISLTSPQGCDGAKLQRVTAAVARLGRSGGRDDHLCGERPA